MLPNAVLFDLDDTILTDDAVSEPAWKEACRNVAEQIKPFNSQELYSQIAHVREWFWSDQELAAKGRLNLYDSRRTIVKMALQKLGCDDERIADEVATGYSNIKEELIGFCPNAENTLGSLVNKDIKLALLTNGAEKPQRLKIDRFGLSKYFSICLIEGELGYGKPDPRFYTTALTKLETLPEHTWMVGDDLERDIAGAQRLGIFSIWHDYSKKGLPTDSRVKPDSVINNISEVLSLVER